MRELLGLARAQHPEAFEALRLMAYRNRIIVQQLVNLGSLELIEQVHGGVVVGWPRVGAAGAMRWPAGQAGLFVAPLRSTGARGREGTVWADTACADCTHMHTLQALLRPLAEVLL